MNTDRAQVNLVVLYVPDIEEMKGFLSAYGLSFEQHQHGNGPIHYGCENNGLVLELYPSNTNNPPTHCRLGIQVKSMESAIKATHDIEAKVVSEPKQSPWGIRGVIELPNRMKLELTQNEAP